MANENAVSITVDDGLGLIALNQPKAISVLNLPNELALADAPRPWDADESGRAVATVPVRT
ncbi:hypothetical protein ACFVJ5_27960 [Nocardia sp. NPDC127606]|uniref:hypothetical protein n=1 Tax=Nocardia sp. NPDC127606 TaxID=3345406 RepID=UPI0036432822